ncbi:MAG: 4Fe-4S binding protein [Methanosarcinales archaeon]|nr:MAG: 4Fe-4S binding protein [Methanosarcinales archaeon]
MKIILCFNSQIIKKPLIAEVILETGALVNINKATIDITGGELIINVPDEDAKKVIKSFKSRGVDIITLEKPIVRTDEECIHCGVCISVCPTNVFRYEADGSVSMDHKECIQCGACITACPHNALKLSR